MAINLGAGHLAGPQMSRRAVLAGLASAAVSASVSSSRAAGPLTLSLWTNTYISQAGKHVFEAYMAATGNTLEVEYIPDPFEQTLLQKWAAGVRPDILYFHAMPRMLLQLNPSETLFDLSDHPFVGAAKGSVLMHSAAFDGVVYGAPLDAPSVVGAFYNKPLFARLNLALPTNAQELSDVLAAIKADGQVPPIFSAGGNQWPLTILPFALLQDTILHTDFAEKLRANEAKLTDPSFVAALQAARDYFDSGYYNKDVMSATLDAELDAVVTGKAGMSFNHTAAVVAAMVDKYGLDAVNENVGFFGISKDDQAVGWRGLSPGIGAGAAYVPKTGDTAKEEAAKAYVDWITGANYASYIAESGTLPYYTGVEPSAKVPQVLLEAGKALDSLSGPTIDQSLFADYGPLPQYMQELFGGTKTAEEVTAALQENYERTGRLIGLPGF